MNEIWFTIEPSRHSEGQWDVIQHGAYESGSVLEGQPKRSTISKKQPMKTITQRDAHAVVLPSTFTRSGK